MDVAEYVKTSLKKVSDHHYAVTHSPISVILGNPRTIRVRGKKVWNPLLSFMCGEIKKDDIEVIRYILKTRSYREQINYAGYRRLISKAVGNNKIDMVILLMNYRMIVESTEKNTLLFIAMRMKNRNIMLNNFLNYLIKSGQKNDPKIIYFLTISYESICHISLLKKVYELGIINHSHWLSILEDIIYYDPNKLDSTQYLLHVLKPSLTNLDRLYKWFVRGQIYPHKFDICIEEFINKGVDINTNNGQLLRLLCEVGTVKLVKTALKLGAKVNIYDLNARKSPLSEAIWYRNIDIVKLLLDNGADIYNNEYCLKRIDFKLRQSSSYYNAKKYKLLVDIYTLIIKTSAERKQLFSEECINRMVICDRDPLIKDIWLKYGKPGSLTKPARYDK